MRDTCPLLTHTDFPAIRRGRLTTLQMNLGYLCNLSCVHCHVDASPNRTELMDRATIETALEFIRHQHIQTLDVTGGSPEMNPHFKYLITQARRMGVHVIDRCNPTILNEPGYEWAVQFLADHQVEIIASLPCYSEQNVKKQRGRDVYERSIKALTRLNALGYGQKDSLLELNLVYNPLDATLPPPQQELENDYRKHLKQEHNIDFNHLFTITNMPIKRFGAILLSKGEFGAYMLLLKNAYQRKNLANVMCRSLISVDYQGYVYDCDFNQMLNMPLGALSPSKTHLSEILNADLAGQPIAIADHCYGCTAGQGSSCGGALDA